MSLLSATCRRINANRHLLCTSVSPQSIAQTSSTAPINTYDSKKFAGYKVLYNLNTVRNISIVNRSKYRMTIATAVIVPRCSALDSSGLLSMDFSQPLSFLSSIKLYSVYPPSYVKPIFKKDQQALLQETGEADRLAHVPIKPAFHDETCSEFHDQIARKFTNFIMRKGKKALARSILEHCFETIKRTQLAQYYKAKPEERSKIILDPVVILHKAIENATPVMTLLGIKKGGNTYQVPVPVTENRRRFLAMSWLVSTCKEKEPRTPYSVALAQELINASNNTGRVVKKKQELHKQCEANRAYAHFRWA